MYAKFGGLGIHNCLLYERVVKLRAENKCITESMAYRSIATSEQALELMVHLASFSSFCCYIPGYYFHNIESVF